jgi:hypothetical protein
VSADRDPGDKRLVVADGIAPVTLKQNRVTK